MTSGMTGNYMDGVTLNISGYLHNKYYNLGKNRRG
jgi:hypothetical protein